ncbi:MAG: hypothetical protein AW10_02133 [Candidatus Accumulibacter appositus]|uniref:Uncharacterized protein n=1 Tax=Candidatus Accumulibacter appositus TaxID=1454003 RepID=A0A011NBJ6_9PROT|nr:MAG: hypothetical protein AW10_02133 [Candidatus Accumulibacter appositus]
MSALLLTVLPEALLLASGKVCTTKRSEPDSAPLLAMSLMRISSPTLVKPMFCWRMTLPAASISRSGLGAPSMMTVASKSMLLSALSAFTLVSVGLSIRAPSAVGLAA